ncbi:DNA-binding protein [Bradyrhizobium sp. NBAIM03]|uniref:helix-turn-helix transcriptional regulator n=1 Tax=Bradyrhizobium sp. NBAIM03 TaxID=2793816 RepID=UPI001CD34D42
MSSPAYLTIDEVIERYRGQVSEGTLRNWRSLRIGPSFIKVGKIPLYPVEELDRWDRSNLVVCQRSRISQMNESVIAKLDTPRF